MSRLAILAATSGHSGVDRNLGNLIPALAAEGVAVDVLKLQQHGPYLTDIPPRVRIVELGVAHVATCLPALVGYLHRERPDALLADKDRVNRTAIWSRALVKGPIRLGVRVGTNVSHNLAARKWRQRAIQKLSIRVFYRYADALIVPSRGVAEDLHQLSGVSFDRIHLLPNPVVTPGLARKGCDEPGHRWLGEKSRPVVLGVGELSARKDFDTLIRAFARMRGQLPSRLIIIGRGRRRDRLIRLADELGVAVDFDLPGFVDNPYAYMRAADLLVLSSRTEGFGNVLVEALALGTPVVATDCPSGPREILEDGRYGELVPVGDDRAMAEAILRTLKSPPSPKVLRKATDRYTVAASARAYMSTLGLTDS